MSFELPPLPYSNDALEPTISAETLDYHHGKHHQAYVTNLNNLVAGTDLEGKSLEEIIVASDGGVFNNAAQIWNHTFYFNGLAPSAGGAPTGAVADLVAGQSTGELSDKELTRLRLFSIGFIFQSFNLVPVLTAFQNVEFPLLLQKGINKAARTERVKSLLEQVGLGDHIQHRPGELSGGQRQRVAVARALVTRPKLVLADEPTANLDTNTGASIIDLMKEINEEQGTAFLFATHDPDVMNRADRVIRLVDGRIVK